MIKKLIITVILLLSLSVAGLSETDAFDRHHEVTPYGDFCKHASHYGMSKSIINMKHAKDALNNCYEEKELDVEIISKQGRFLKVNIKDGNDIVDTIIFDRHSGRMRSIN